MLSPTFASRTRVSPLFYSTVIILCVLSRGLTLAASTHSGSLSVSEQCLKSGKEAWTGGQGTEHGAPGGCSRRQRWRKNRQPARGMNLIGEVYSVELSCSYQGQSMMDQTRAEKGKGDFYRFLRLYEPIINGLICKTMWTHF